MAAMAEAKSRVNTGATSMNQAEAQPECDRRPVYFDPEAPDPSEQEFSASLESETAQPVFVADEPEAVGSGCVQEAARQSESSTETSISACNHGNTDLDAIPDPLSGEDRDSRGADWRRQVSAKVSSYKSRSRHKPRYPSLQLQFEERQIRARDNEETAPIALQTFSQSVAAEIVAMQPALTPALDSPRITLEATARVLEFPRPAPPPLYHPDELAEPVFDRPRIVEAPELLPLPPAMGGILIEPPLQPEPERRPGFDMPLASASLSRRVWAGVMDGLVLAIAVSMFIYIFVAIADTAPPWRTVVGLSATLLAVLWPAYEYAFLIFSQSTPGLRLARLQIQRFDGSPAPRSLRRWRVLAAALSAVPLGLGYAWCFLDEDQLTWHDRITRTHLAPTSDR
jgi:uncharacterized RDD family membrane protein YckC